MGRMPRDIRIWGRIVGVRSTKQFVRHPLNLASKQLCIKGKKNMDEKILVMNDLPGYGKVALAASEPVLSHFGYHVYNLPTALVSNTLNYGKFQILDTTEYMQGAVSVWEELGFTFDAVMTGFILSESSLLLSKSIAKNRQKKGQKLLWIPSWETMAICIMGYQRIRWSR